jgi:small ligand-binding sensory domain FIST
MILIFIKNAITSYITASKATPWLRRVVAGLSPQSHRFVPLKIYVGIVVDKMVLGEVPS